MRLHSVLSLIFSGWIVMRALRKLDRPAARKRSEQRDSGFPTVRQKPDIPTTARRKSTASLPSRAAFRASAGVLGYCDPTGNLYNRGNAHSVDVVKSHYASTAEPMFLA
jgi:hypothetical protein